MQAITKIGLAIALSVATLSAQAGVDIRPAIKVYAPGQKAGVMTITNSDDYPRTFQLIVDELKVVDGKAVKVPSTDLRFAPSLITVPAKTTQTVRFKMTAPVGSERMFRTTALELPPVDFTPTESGITYLVKMSLPWFWRDQALEPQLSARWEGGDLLVKNTGAATAQLSMMTAGSFKKDGLVGYVMPGAEERFKLGLTAKVATIALNIDGKPATLDVK